MNNLRVAWTEGAVREGVCRCFTNPFWDDERTVSLFRAALDAAIAEMVRNGGGIVIEGPDYIMRSVDLPLEPKP